MTNNVELYHGKMGVSIENMQGKPSDIFENKKELFRGYAE